MFLEHPEFDKRYYQWCIFSWEHEVDNDFPFLRLTQDFASLSVLNNMDKNQVLVTSMGLVKRGNDVFLKRINDHLTPEEKCAVKDFLDKSWSVHDKQKMYDVKALQRKKLDKKKLKQSIFDILEEKLGSDITDDGGGEFFIETQVEKSVLRTNLDFGGKSRDVGYCHSVRLNNGRVIGRNISVLSWLGMMGQTDWSFLVDEDIAQTAESIVTLCNHFISTLPKLIDGLDPDEKY